MEAKSGRNASKAHAIKKQFFPNSTGFIEIKKITDGVLCTINVGDVKTWQLYTIIIIIIIISIIHVCVR